MDFLQNRFFAKKNQTSHNSKTNADNNDNGDKINGKNDILQKNNNTDVEIELGKKIEGPFSMTKTQRTLNSLKQSGTINNRVMEEISRFESLMDDFDYTVHYLSDSVENKVHNGKLTVSIRVGRHIEIGQTSSIFTTVKYIDQDQRVFSVSSKPSNANIAGLVTFNEDFTFSHSHTVINDFHYIICTFFFIFFVKNFF